MTDEGGAVDLNELLAACRLPALDAAVLAQFDSYCSLLLRWNARTNLTAIRDREGIYSRHFVESILCAHALPSGISTLLDFGAGAGFPGIPIALVRPEIAVTLAESQGKKAAFLREAARVLGIPVKVHGDRAELLSGQFDCVTLRAVDRIRAAIPVAAGLVAPGGYLALMTTEQEMASIRSLVIAPFSWLEPIPMPGGERRIISLARRSW
jgi:16S rRNA (guanine527-N7)-methyltransferase